MPVEKTEPHRRFEPIAVAAGATPRNHSKNIDRMAYHSGTWFVQNSVKYCLPASCAARHHLVEWAADFHFRAVYLPNWGE